MTEYQSAVVQFRLLPPKKRRFVTCYTEHMEGSWGELAEEGVREWHYFVLEAAVGTAFTSALKDYMEMYWTMHRDAEGAFRDFHYFFTED